MKVRMKMTKRIFYLPLLAGLLLLLFQPGGVYAQDRSDSANRQSQNFVKKAERAKKEGNFVEAEANYRRAIGVNAKNAEANYNFGHLYGDKKMEADGMNQLFHTLKNSKDKSLRHKAFHNLGNAYMKQEDYKQAVSAYKDALRNNPADDETRYNLAIAKKMLEDNPDDEQGQDDQDEDDNDDESQDNQEEQEDESQEGDDDDQDDDQDGEGENQEEDEGEDEESGGGESDQEEDDDSDPDENQGEENEDTQDQPRPDLMSDEQAENLLRAAENLEKGVQEKLNAEKGEEFKGKPNKKDW